MATSRLQRYVSEQLGIHLAKFDIYENTRPAWLGGSELDFYIPEIEVAIEVQGNQHFEYVPHFHGTYQNFLDQRRRDIHKKEICFERGITLHEVGTELDADILVIDLKKLATGEEEEVYFTDPIAPPIEPKKYTDDLQGHVEKLKDYISYIYYNEKLYAHRALREITWVMAYCLDNKVDVHDQDVIEFYLANKTQIDARVSRIRNSKKRLRRKHPEIWERERVVRVTKKLEDYRLGILQAPPEKIAEWERLIACGGKILPTEIEVQHG